MTVKDEWVNYQNQVREDDVNFLRQPAVAGTMFQGDGELFLKEYEYIKENNEEYLSLFSSPSSYGSPLTFEIDDETYNPNDIHHLYHICRYENNIGTLDDNLDVLEWGGGYGNMCKVLHMLKKIKSYTIIDLPKFTSLSERYVATTVPMSASTTTHLPVDNFKGRLKEKYDLFISNWALSESPTEWTSYLDEISFCDADHFLVSVHQCGDHIPFMAESTNLRNVLQKYETKEEDVSVISGINYYIFK
jgi:hypothetical protein